MLVHEWKLSRSRRRLRLKLMRSRASCAARIVSSIHSCHVAAPAATVRDGKAMQPSAVFLSDICRHDNKTRFPRTLSASSPLRWVRPGHGQSAGPSTLGSSSFRRSLGLTCACEASASEFWEVYPGYEGLDSTLEVLRFGFLAAVERPADASVSPIRGVSDEAEVITPGAARQDVLRTLVATAVGAAGAG